MERTSDVIRVRDKFEVHCNAGDAGTFRASSELISIKVGQRILRDGIEEMWDSILISGGQAEDGSIQVRVLVFHPDWDEPLQIAHITSRPSDHNCETAIGCNLDHVAQ
jgi:hypothetical protein